MKPLQIFFMVTQLGVRDFKKYFEFLYYQYKKGELSLTQSLWIRLMSVFLFLHPDSVAARNFKTEFLTDITKVAGSDRGFCRYTTAVKSDAGLFDACIAVARGINDAIKKHFKVISLPKNERLLQRFSTISQYSKDATYDNEEKCKQYLNTINEIFEFD